MREILFRGKRVDNGEWVEGDLAHTHSVKDGVKLNNTLVGGDMVYSEVTPETVGQFTGLIDKEGRKAFFGDIVTYFDQSGTERKGVIKQYKDSWGGFIQCVGGDEEGNQDGELDHDKFMIIGNIHDNPELLNS
jgi:uncharacterized phage protein (TIGR01671 family)